MAQPTDDVFGTNGTTLRAGRHASARPRWKRIPTLSFVVGTPATVDLKTYGIDAAGASYLLGSGALPAGCTLSADGVLAYDGAGSVGSSTVRVAARVGANITSFSLTSSTGGSLLPWSLGHPFAQGDVPSGEYITADVPEFQAAVQNRWPDGSVKFAVLSGRCDLSAGVARTVSLSTSPVNPNAAASPISEGVLNAADVSCAVGSYGTVTLPPLVGNAFRQFVSGPVMSEWHYRAPVGLDSHLVVWFYVRAYAGGKVEVTTSIENGYCNMADPSNKVAAVTLTVGGVTAYASGSDLDIKHHTRMVVASHWSGAHWIGGDPDVVPSHSPAYWRKTKMVPNYMASTITETRLNALAATYAPQGIGDLPGIQLGGTGDHKSIGYLPQWDVCYVVSGDARAYRSVLVNSMYSAGYSYHYRHEATNKPIRFADFPTQRLGNLPTPIGGYLYWSNQYGAAWDASHAYLPGYTAYLVSGRYWHVEELQFAVTWVFLSLQPAYRGNGVGMITQDLQIRGIGWALRNLACCAAIVPDGDPDRMQYRTAFAASMVWQLGYQTNSLGVALDKSGYGFFYNTTRGARISLWMTDYVTVSMAMAADLQIEPDATARANTLAFRNWLCAGVVGRFGGETDGWCYRFQRYETYITTKTANAAHADIFTDWAAAFQLNYSRANGADLYTPATILENPVDDNVIPAGWYTKTSFNPNYFEYAMCALAAAVDAGAPGAITAWSRVTGATNFATCRNALSGDPRWGLEPRG